MDRNTKTRIDIIIVLCWIISYVILAIYGSKREWDVGTIALWLSAITPIVLGVRSMFSSWFFEYPILKPVLVNETGSSRPISISLMLENEGTEVAKSANVWCLANEGGIEKLDCKLLARRGYIIHPGGQPVTGGVYPGSVFLPHYLDKDEKVHIKVETIGINSKKTYCACRVFMFIKEGIYYWNVDNKEDRNTKPYWFNFKPCENCKFLRETNGGKVVSNE